MSELITLDFETRSAAEIGDVGSYLYSLHPTTSVLVLSWAIGNGEILTWHPAFPAAGLAERGRPELLDLLQRVRLGEMVEAHNVSFERAIWTHVCVPRLGWPALDPNRLRCSAAKASYYGIPRGLEDAGRALRLAVVKDETARRVMLKLAKPRKPLLAELKKAGLGKGQHELFWLLNGHLWHEGRADLDRLIEYNRQDVRAERALSMALPDVPANEIEVWLMDQRINWEGVRVDLRGVRRALALANEFRARADARVNQLSGGKAPNCRKRVPFQKWVESRGVPLPNTQAATIEEMVKRPDLPADVSEACKLWSSAGRASVKKYDSILDRVVIADERVRDILRYCGAGHTGRWAGMGIQVHNFPKGKFNSNEKIEAVWHDIATMSLEQIAAKYGDPMVFLSHALRGALVPSDGCDFLVSDFSAIEARLTFWHAGQEDALATIRSGLCIYKEMAGVIYELKTPQNLARDSKERDLGKRIILGGGFGMGPEKFVATCLKEGGLVVPLELGETSIGAYRERYDRVPLLWKGLEKQAIAAVESPNQRFRYGRLIYGMRGPFLHCRLPSGRLLSYAWPSVKPRRTPWGQVVKGLSFWGVDSKTHQWVQISTWGGTLTENAVQATARDLMSEAMVRCERAGYRTAITVHDEIVSDCRKGHGSLKEFEALMAELPTWAEGFPNKADGWQGPRYRK